MRLRLITRPHMISRPDLHFTLSARGTKIRGECDCVTGQHLRAALMCRRVSELTVAAVRERREPCAGSVAMSGVHQQMVTFVNVNSRRCQPRVDLDRLTRVGGPVFTRHIEQEFEKRAFQVMLEVRL